MSRKPTGNSMVRMDVRLPRDLDAGIAALAKLKDTTKSNLIRLAIERYVAELESRATERKKGTA